MGASIKAAGGGAGRRRKGRRHAPMSEINVTPFVDVMLVLLIIFMVTAPMLTAGVPVDLPSTKGATQLDANKEPLVVSVNAKGEIFIGETPYQLNEIGPKLKAIAKNGVDEQIFVKGDQGISYGTVMKVMDRIKLGGFRKVGLITDPESGG